MAIFNNRYRVESARLESWDYTWPGWYYITVNTRHHELFFGDIYDDEMHLSPIGEIVSEEWIKTPTIRPSVELDYWQIMPNHLHGIIIIDQKANLETTRRVVSTTLQPESLGSIIGQFKSVCTKRIHNTGNKEFAWQPRFFDHIIRNAKDLERIRDYIKNNVLEWAIDEYHPSNRSLYGHHIAINERNSPGKNTI